MLKKVIQSALLLVVLFTTVQSYAQVSQAPDGIQFQALATDANGHPAAGRVIYVKDAIIAKTATGTIVYSETFKVTASSAGIFTIVLGKGTYASGVSSIANIDWANGPFFLNLKIAVEPTVPTSSWNVNNEYVDLGTSQFWSVPYALYSGGVKGLDTKLNIADTAAMLKPYFTAINLKANIESPTFTGTVSGITKAMVGLANVDNTSDLNKPISTATQTALDLKANAADVTTALNLKANTADVNTELALKANATDVTAALNLKANTADVTTTLSTKVDKVTGKELSTNDYTTAEKTKLAAITGTNTGDQDLSALAVAADVNTALALKANTADVNAALALKANAANVASSLAAKADVVNVNNAIAAINTSLNTKANTADVNAALALKANSASLSAVATTGSYNDLSNKPTIPSAYTLPLATASVVGGIKVGSNLSIDANGVLSATASNNASSITGTLPVANGGTGTTTVAGIKYLLGFSGSKVAIGDQAGQTGQQNYTIAIGAGAGASNQSSGGIAIGGAAGGTNQGSSTVAIGSNAGQANQSQRTVAVGFAAGQNNQGENAVALGTFAGNNGQAANSIAINATGMSTPLNPTNAGFYVNPVRNALAANSLFYDATTKEITYGTASASGVPYTGATGPVNLGAYNLTVNGLSLGKGAGSNNGVNTAFGASALAANTTGAYNTAIGFQVLTNNTTGNNNHALGFQALAANTSGSRNTAFGEASLPRNTTGSDNVAIGLTALFRNTTADNNIAIGTQALGNSLTGSNNIAIGSQALTGNSTSSNNTAVGYQSLKETSGSDNTALGRLSLMGNTTGSFNTAVGSLADVNSNNLSNTTAIGYGARVLANNTIQLGADGTGFVTNGVNISTTPISNVRTSGSLTAGAVTYPNTNGTAGQVLTANNNGNASWTTIASVADANTMTGTVAITKGGTGATTATAALTNLGAAPIASPTFTGIVTTGAINAGAITATSVNSPIYASTPQVLTAGSAISWNPALGLNASVTLNQNSTLDFSTTPLAGAYGTLVITQGTGGNFTITLPSTSNKVLGSTSTTTIALSSAAGAKDILNFYYDGANCFWNIGQGYGTAAVSTATNLATGVTGTLTVANGGTGATTSTGTGNVVLSVSPALTGTPTAPTAAPGTNNTQVATTAFVSSALSSSGLPSQSGNNGKFLTTNGSTVSWASSAGVPYSGASGAVNLGDYNLTVRGVKIGTSGTDNFALINNMVIGRDALVNTTNGYNNMAIGNTALYTNVGGYNNVGIGNESQYKNLWGWGNVSLGVATINQNETGNFNTAVGHSAGYFLTSSYNTAIGHNALDGQADGGGNTGVGVNAGAVPWNQRTYNSTFLGYNAKAQSGLDNVIVIGYNAYTNEHHTIQLGDNRIVKLKTSGTIWSNGSQLTSDLRLKTNIKPLPNSIDLIMKLNPVSYNKKNSIESKDYNKTENGFIAQELQKVIPYIVKEGADKDKILSVDYNSIIPVLTKGIQEQQFLITAQQKQIDEMKLILQSLLKDKK